MPESTPSMGTTERLAHDGLRTAIRDNTAAAQFEATVGGEVIGWQPYRRNGGHIVLMSTEVDEQWRARGVSSAMIDGALGLIRDAGATVIPRCKLTGDYILRNPQYLDLVADQYRTLLKPVSRPGPST
jgi:predicted GNAT family acetyltransferase